VCHQWLWQTRHQGLAGTLEITTDELETWARAAAQMFIPYDAQLGVHPQSDGFTRHEKWDFEHTGADQYPLLLHFPHFDLYCKQVVKQAELVLAMHVRSDAFTADQEVRNFEYYEAITVWDSSLSSSVQAILGAEMGQLDLAYDYLAESAFLDLDDTEHNTCDGLHIAALAGIWSALVAGYGGMRHDEIGLAFSPRLPRGLTRMNFGVRIAGRYPTRRGDTRQRDLPSHRGCSASNSSLRRAAGGIGPHAGDAARATGLELGRVSGTAGPPCARK
jgi:alpha,alpha-trehalose phosphorylase